MPLATIITLVNTFKEPLLKLFSDVKTELEFFLDNGLSDYVESIESKFANTKTFLYRNENIPFYDTFFPVSLLINKNIKKVTTYDDLFGESRFVSIIGTAGSGKTMLMKHFFLTSISSAYKIPIFIELRNLNDYEGTFTNFIYEIIFNNKLSPSTKILERLLTTGYFIFILDGYDEIYSQRKNKITNDLEKFIDRYSKNNFIVSSRPGSGIESLPRFNNHYVQELRDGEVFQFIDIVLKEADDKQLGAKIKEVVSKSSDSGYSNFLRSPLLLSMFILTFNTYPELPNKKSKFFWNVFDTLSTKHDSLTKKAGYQHERKTGLQNEDFEKILQYFSYKSLFQGKYSFDAEYLNKSLSEIKSLLNYQFSMSEIIDDLTVAISIMVIDGIEYKFPHKSLQEYFSAMLIREQNNETKVKIYSEKLVNQMKNSMGGLRDFWNLCHELDKFYFIKYFILPQLKDFRGLIYDKDLIKQLQNFYEFAGFKEDVISSHGTIRWLGSTRVSNDFLLYEELIEYVTGQHLIDFTLVDNVIPDEVLSKYISKNGGLSILDSSSDGPEYYIFYLPHHWNKFIIKQLQRAKYDIAIQSFMSSLEQKMFEYEKELKSDQNISNLLLEL